MLLGSIAGVGIFTGLVTVLAILVILKQRNHRQRDTSAADAESTPKTPSGIEAGRWRVALAVLITGVLVLSLGLPAALLALSANSVPAAGIVSPPEATTEPPANVTQPTPPETAPDAPPLPEAAPEPEASPEPAAPDNFLVSNLTLTPDPESGHNWYQASVNIANAGDAAGTMLLAARVGDRPVTPQQVTLGGGENVTLELKSLAREIGFLATMYEGGVITQRRHEVVVQNLREMLVFEYPSRLEDSVSGNIIQPDWEIIGRDISDVETLFDGGETDIHRLSWQVTLRSNTPPHRVFTITVTFLDASGEIIRRDAFENNELPRWDTLTFRGFITLSAEEKERFASYQISLLCTSGCGESVD